MAESHAACNLTPRGVYAEQNQSGKKKESCKTMSGHSSFNTIGMGHQPIPQQIPQPSVSGAQTANVQMAPGGVGAQQPEQVAQVADNGAERTENLVRELDVLLTKAGASAVNTLDVDALSKALARLDRKGEIKKQAQAAIKAMRALDSFTGMNIMQGMNVKNENGTFSVVWNEKSAVYKAIHTALDKQSELSNALTKLYNSLPANVSPERMDTIMEAIFQCDRRISEISTLSLEIANAAENISKKFDAATAARLDRRVIDIVGEKALEMHDTKAAIESFKAQFAEISKRLDYFYKNQSQVASEKELQDFQGALNAAKSAIDNAVKTGAINVGGRTIQVDRTVLGEIARLLGAASGKLDDVKRNAINAYSVKFIEKEVPRPGFDLFKPEICARLREAIAKNVSEATAKVLKDFLNAVDSVSTLRKALHEYIAAPSKKTQKKVDDLGKEMKKTLFYLDDISKLYEAASKISKAVEDEDPALSNALKQFQYGATTEDDQKNLFRQVRNVCDHVNVIFEHLTTLRKNMETSNVANMNGVILGVVSGEGSFTTLLESRVHGYNDGEIDMKLDDKNVAESKQLGSGAFNTVDLVTFKDGTKKVFKPEFTGRLASESLSLLSGTLKPTAEITNINLAVNKTADILGLDDVMVKTTPGVHNGTFGLYMDKAPGLEGANLSTNGCKEIKDKQGDVISLGMAQIKGLSPEERRHVKGQMMRQFNRLQWLDIITGQGDRHPHNYMVKVDGNLSVTVKGIDNDAGFTPYRTGLNTFRIPKSKAGVYVDVLKEHSETFGLKIDVKDVMEKIKMGSEPGMSISANGSIEIDLSKVKSAFFVWPLSRTVGFKAVAVPNEIDSDLYDSLMKLKGDTQERRALLGDWAKRFGEDSEQYRCAVKRLDESIEHAETLNKNKKVFTKDDWGKDDTQQYVIDSKPKQTTMIDNMPISRWQRTDFPRHFNFLMADNLYVRDFKRWTEEGI